MDQVEEIKQAIDIAQVIGSKIQLQRSGKQFRGLCPFHSEKSPSFFVSPDIQRYKCFGCGKSGDVLTFLQEYENLSFIESLRLLADQAGITLQKRELSSEDKKKDVLFEILNLASEYYHYLLTEHKEGEPARAYIKDRKISQSTVESFKLGFATDRWDGLLLYLTKKKRYTLQDIESAGLILKGKSGRHYDRFRNRVIFPLTDALGRVVGFSGRLLDASAKEAKYINSPETSLYHKSSLLFGYSQLKQSIRKAGEVVVVEGEMDVLSSVQAGVKQIVAIKGSAFTDQQAKLLARSVKKIIFALDADSAGVEATKRAIQVARPYEVSIRVIPLKGGKDPDDIARNNPSEWKSSVKSSIPAYEFVLEHALDGLDLTSGEGKRDATQRIVPILASIHNSVEQGHYVQSLAKQLNTKEEFLTQEIRKYAQKSRLSIGNREQDQSSEQEEEFTDPQSSIERYTLSLLFHLPLKEQKNALTILSADLFLEHQTKKLFQLFEKHAPIEVQLFARKLEPQWHTIFTEIYLYLDRFLALNATEITDERILHEWNSAIPKIKDSQRKQRLLDLSQQLQQAKSVDEKLKIEKELQTLLK